MFDHDDSKKRDTVKFSVKINNIKHKLVDGGSSFLKFLEDSTKGLMAASVLLSSWVMMGFVRFFYPVFPWAACVVIALMVVVIIDEFLFLVTKLLFRNRRRGVIYGFVEFLFMLAGLVFASQARHILSDLIFAFAAVLCSNYFGRSVWMILVKKRYSVITGVILAASFLALSAGGIFLHNYGIENHYIEEYLTAGREKLQDTENPTLALADLAQGKFNVGWAEYGFHEESSMLSGTADISELAERDFFTGGAMKQHFGYELSQVPLAGKIWYPEEADKCPVLFMVHGNHAYPTESYLGYDYLGQFLASHGYVVVSVDEQSCNNLNNENDARAVLLLENIKMVLEYNKDEQNPIYQKIDEEKIALGGHSRGGEAVALAYLFNGYDSYPDNGTITFDYGFSIKSIISIAPTIDMYMPAERQVVLTDVNYLLLQGANDHDITVAMGEKQYMNILFTGEGDYIKSMLYIAGANHGQFNSRWGKYDLIYPVNCYLNVAELMPEDRQQAIAKAFIKAFLDDTLLGDSTREPLLKNCQAYEAFLAEAIYQQMYQTSDFQLLSNFEEDSDLNTASMDHAGIAAENVSVWKEMRRIFGSGGEGENYVLDLTWEDTREAELSFFLPETNMADKEFVFDIADMNENIDLKDDVVLLEGRVILTDAEGLTASAFFGKETVIYPSLPVMLGKIEGLFGEYDWKHSFQTVTISPDKFEKSQGFDHTRIKQIAICFDYDDNGRVQLDNLGFVEP